MDLAIEQWHRSSPETGLATALNQLAIFKCELPHVSRSLDAERERRTSFCLGWSVAQ
jgi:hypothetical protein